MAHAKVRSGTEIRMTKIRADGTQVDLGVVSAEYNNPLRQWWWTHVGRRLADARIRRENRQSCKTPNPNPPVSAADAQIPPRDAGATKDATTPPSTTPQPNPEEGQICQ